MSGFGRAVVLTIVAVSGFVIFINVAFFFPWYLTMVETGFEVSQLIATDNYLKLEHYEDIMEELQEKPIFSLRPDNITIEAIHDNGDGDSAIEPKYLGPYRDADYYYGLDENDQPYVQMGQPVLVTVSARYPFQIQLFDSPLTLTDIAVSFSMTTVTTKHYKDLYYAYSSFDVTDTTGDNFINWNMGP